MVKMRERPMKPPSKNPPSALEIVGGARDGTMVAYLGPRINIAKAPPLQKILDQQLGLSLDPTPTSDVYIMVWSGLSEAWVYIWEPLLKKHMDDGRAEHG